MFSKNVTFGLGFEHRAFLRALQDEERLILSHFCVGRDETSEQKKIGTKSITNNFLAFHKGLGPKDILQYRNITACVLLCEQKYSLVPQCVYTRIVLFSNTGLFDIASPVEVNHIT